MSTPANGPAVGQAPFGQGGITRLGFHLRDLFRAKRWQSLGRQLGIDEIWFFDAPLAVASALERAEESLADFDDIQVELERIQKSQRTDLQGSGGAEASGTYTCTLLGFDRQRLRQLEVSFDLHLGFRRQADALDSSDELYDGWRLERLGLSAATPEAVRHPQGDDPDASLPVSAHSLVADADGHVVVYMPVRVPLDQARALLTPTSQEATSQEATSQEATSQVTTSRAVEAMPEEEP